MDLKVLKSQWDRAAAIVLTVLGAICLIAGYLGVADSQILAEQTRYIVSGGLGGIFLLGMGATLWVSADLRDEWVKLDRIERALGDGVLRWSEATPSSGSHRAMPPATNGAAAAPAKRPVATENGDLARSAQSREHA